MPGVFHISKVFRFSAAHHLDRLSPDHKCFRQHGHNYKVTVELQGDYASVMGSYEKWLMDYGELRPLRAFIDQHLDHQDLNVVLSEVFQIFDVQPTAEVLAFCLFRWCAAQWPTVIYRVTVQETEDTSASYSEPAVATSIGESAMTALLSEEAASGEVI